MLPTRRSGTHQEAMLWKNSMGPEKSPQEVLAGLVERVTYHNVENGFCVLRASNVGGGAK
jgi:hypothetical protein